MDAVKRRGAAEIQLFNVIELLLINSDSTDEENKTAN